MIMIMNNFIPSVLGVLLFLTGIFTTSPSLNLPVENTGNDHNRVKRSRPCQDKFKIIPDHTACLDRSSKVQESGLQGNEADVIVDQHNKVRTEVSAMNMLKMSWDEDVAFIAQRWAENCQIDHDPNYNRYNYGRFSVGQNLAWGNFKMTWSQAIKLWADEKAYYTYGSRSGAGGKAIGHYTQMVWAESAKIGCGYANCAGTHYYVCNYAPAGNLDPAFPYKRGLRCADCPSKCSNGLCDCGNKVCLNGGKMDLDKCTCTCNEGLPFYFQPSCSLNCTEIHDPNWCSQYGESGCSKYTNVPQECPSMCNWCPAAGATYDGKTSSASYATSVLITVLLSVLSVFSI
ncbi:hypothetical protein ACJMK2_020136 [Sinanodonta woodiana]|uniref:SCP domain-containing protein n=1 Tax=Sinanodonta woodiana TaxID=1069815 RepID=A0ABD3TZV0_SINWO